MLPVAACPSVEELRGLIQGGPSGVDADRLEQHVLECQSCTTTLNDLLSRDTLCENLRSGETSVEKIKTVQPDAERLILEVRKLQARRCPTPRQEETEMLLGRVTDAASEVAFLAPAQRPDEIGRLGNYRVLKILGKGGMGMVFQAEDTALERLVALKVMQPQVAKRADARERFLREAKAIAKIEHDHIVPIFQVSEANGVPFLAMPCLKGLSLDDYLKKATKVPLAQVLRLGRQTALGLAAAHSRGVVHRDIKPANLWIEPEQGGRIKILDFGLARPVEAGEMQLTQCGDILGTPAFMSPEQAVGGKVGPASDLFSLGVVLYRLVTGTLPFRGPTPGAIFVALGSHQPDAPRKIDPAIPAALSDLIMQLLAKDAAQRPPSAQEVAQRLQSLEREVKDASLARAETPIAVARQTTSESDTIAVAAAPQTSPRKPRRRRVAVIASAVALAAVLILGAFTLTLRTRNGTLVIHVPEGNVQVLVDGKEELKLDAPRQARLNLAPGKHRVSVQRDGKELWHVEFTTVAGEPVEYTARFDATKPGPAPKLADLKLANQERLASLPPEVVTVLGSHAWRHGFDAGDYGGPKAHVAFGSDGKSVLALATTAFESDVHLWDAATGEPKMAPLPLCRWKPFMSGGLLGWSPDFQVLAVVAPTQGGFYDFQVWDVAANKKRFQVRGADAPKVVAFAPDGKWFAAYAYPAAPALTRVDAFTGKVLADYPWINNVVVDSLSVSADGKRLAAGGWELGKKTYFAKVWDVATKQDRAEIKKPMPVANATLAALSPDLTTLAAGGPDGGFGTGVIQLWDVMTGKEGPKIWPKSAHVTHLAWSADGAKIALATAQGPVYVYEAATGKERQILTGHAPGYSGATLAFAPDGKRLASAGTDGTIRLWDLATGKQLNNLPEPVACLAIGSDDRTLAVLREKKNVIEFWDLATGNHKKHPALELPNNWSVYYCGVHGWCKGATFTPDLKTVYFAANEWIQAFEPATGKSMEGASRLVRDFRTSFYVAADGKTIAVMQTGGEVELWSVASGKSHILRGVAKNGNLAAAFSPDGSVALVADKDKGITRWEVATGKELQPIRWDAAGELATIALALSRDGKRLAASAWNDKMLRVWDAATLAPVASLQSEIPFYDWIGFGADDRTVIAVAGAQGRITLFASDKERRDIRLPTSIKGFALSSDGRYGFASNYNGTVYVLRLDGPIKLVAP